MRRRVCRIGAIGLAVIAVTGCSMFDPDLSFDESTQVARANAERVAGRLGDAERLARVSIGPLDCGGNAKYASLTGYLPLDAAPGESELDLVGDVVSEMGFEEDVRDVFASGPYRLWRDDDGLTISVTVVTAESAVDIETRGPCARPPE